MRRALFGLALGSLLVTLPFVGCGGSSTDSSNDTCPVASCGGPPPAHCADGSSPSMNCVRMTGGSCGWQIDCPKVDASSTDASDATDAPADG